MKKHDIYHCEWAVMRKINNSKKIDYPVALFLLKGDAEGFAEKLNIKTKGYYVINWINE